MNNCILVDISDDVDIIKETTGKTLPVTNRATLAKALNFLRLDSDKIDLIIVDVYFDKKGQADADLLKAFKPWADDSKLILAKVEGTTLFYEDRQDILGFTTQTMNNNFLFEHSLFDEKDGSYSLPYLAYLKLTHTNTFNNLLNLEDFALEKENDRGISTIIQREFVPVMYVSEDDIKESYELTDAQPSAVYSKNGVPYKFSLTDFNDDDTEILSYRLNLNKAQGNKNIVCISVFNDPMRDVSNTVFGPMHGGLIQLNIIYNLLHGNHKKLFENFGITWLILFLLAFLQVYTISWKEKHRTELPKKDNESLLELFADEFHIITIIAVVIIIHFTTNALPNIMFTATFFIINERLLRRNMQFCNSKMIKK